MRVTMDGQLRSEALDGKAVPVDPGTHTLRFEHGGETPIDQQIVVREGEKSRVVTVSWAKVVASTDAGGDRGSAPAASSGTAAWVFGGLGAVSLATFGVLGIHGATRRSDLERECFGRCSQTKIDSVKTEFAVADVALGVGIVSAPARTSFGFAPHRDGAAASVSGRF